MRKKNDIFTPPAKPWQPRWWRENPERWRWAGTITLVIMLMGAFAYQNPDIWRNTVPPQLAEAEAEQGSGDNPPVQDTDAALPEPQATPSATPPIAAQAQPDTEQETAEQATTTAAPPQATDAEDAEPDGMQKLEAAAAVAVSTPPASWQQPGYGVWVRDYGYALDPTQGDYRFHHGCDLELSVGSPVFAAASGKVLLAGEDAAWGGVVIVEHGGGWRSIYKGVKPEVSAGTALVAGEQLGLVLASPPAEQAQASHLHFEMELDGQKQNPAQWL